MGRDTDYGVLVRDNVFRFVDGVEVEAIVPANIREDRPMDVWVVKPGPSWVVAGEIVRI